MSDAEVDTSWRPLLAEAGPVPSGPASLSTLPERSAERPEPGLVEELAAVTDTVRALVTVLDGSTVTELEVHVGRVRIGLTASRPAPPSASVTAARPPVEGEAVAAGDGEPATTSTSPALREPPTSPGTAVLAPMVGVFYRSPSPGKPPFVQVGDVVTPGTQVGLMEAMKTYNSVVAGVSGTVLEITASDGEVVEFDQPLLYLTTG